MVVKKDGCRKFLEANFLLAPFVVAVNALVFFAWFYADFYSWLYYAGLHFEQVSCTRTNSTIIVKYSECTRIGNPEFSCVGFLHQVTIGGTTHYGYSASVDFGWRGPVFEVYPYSSPYEAETIKNASYQHSTTHTCYIQHYTDVFTNQPNEFIILDLKMESLGTVDGLVYMAIFFPFLIFNLICTCAYYLMKPQKVQFFNSHSYQQIESQDIPLKQPVSSLHIDNQIEVELTEPVVTPQKLLPESIEIMQQEPLDASVLQQEEEQQQA